MLNIIVFLVIMYCLVTYAIAVYMQLPYYIVARNSSARDRIFYFIAFALAPISVPAIIIYGIKNLHW